MTNQTTSILEARGPLTVKEITAEVKLSESRVRELLKKAVADGEVTKTKEGKVFVFDAVRPEPAPEAVVDVIGDKPKKARSEFLGHPEASRNKNPQSTINAKRGAVKADNGDMAFDRKTKLWNIVSGDGSSLDLTSSELASMTLEQFKLQLNIK